ncbi:MAG: AAA family ATPase [Candidatus Saccharibacteria bacterium]|nr:AAA family ATPase [Rhodoferax sp.]
MDSLSKTILSSPDGTISLAQIAEQAERAEALMVEIRVAMLAPNAGKSSPVYSLSQLAQFCDVAKGSITHRMTRGDLPEGKLNGNGSKREFTLAETRQWTHALRKKLLRPDGARAITISMANFKGGTTKTSTCMTLAQGLSLRGHKVLAIDCDPQGSLTTLTGKLPVNIEAKDTLMPVLLGDEKSIRPAIQKTYWDGVDLVAANPLLFGAEFALPARQMKEPSFEFWGALDKGIEDVRDDYDVIVIDTPPALSYITINALMASNGLVMPLPPSFLDFAASIQFWGLFSELTSELLAQREAAKTFDFIHVLLSKVDSQDAAGAIVRKWISQAYAEKVLPLEIPKSAVATSSSAEFRTVYDVTKYDGNARTFKRAHQAYDLFVDHLEQSIQQAWRRQVAAKPVKRSSK